MGEGGPRRHGEAGCGVVRLGKAAVRRGGRLASAARTLGRPMETERAGKIGLEKRRREGGVWGKGKEAEAGIAGRNSK